MARHTVRSFLRESIADDHARVDASFSRFDLSNQADYGRFLLAQAWAYLPIERAIDASDIESFVPDWPERRRGEALLDDLRTMSITAPQTIELPPYSSVEETLGALYVLEGSRLGGGILAKQVPDKLPRKFLQANDKTLWGRLIEVLDTVLISDQQQETAARAARDVFARFEAAARLQ